MKASPENFLEFPKNQNFSLENEVFPNIIKNSTLYAVELDVDFIDIGIPKDYLEFCSWMEEELKDDK